MHRFRSTESLDSLDSKRFRDLLARTQKELAGQNAQIAELEDLLEREQLDDVVSEDLLRRTESEFDKLLEEAPLPPPTTPTESIAIPAYALFV